MQDHSEKPKDSKGYDITIPMCVSSEVPAITDDLAQPSEDCIMIGKLLAKYKVATWLKCPTCGHIWWTNGHQREVVN